MLLARVHAMSELAPLLLLQQLLRWDDVTVGRHL